MNGLRPRSGFGFASCLAPCLHVALILIAVIRCPGGVISGCIVFPVGIFIVGCIFSCCALAGAVLLRVCILVTVGCLIVFCHIKIGVLKVFPLRFYGEVSVGNLFVGSYLSVQTFV